MTDTIDNSRGSNDPEDADTSALVSRTLSWADAPEAAFWPKDRVVQLLGETVLWQGVTRAADVSLMFSSTFGVSTEGAGYRVPTLEEINRLKEILSLVGGIGEQAGLAWSAYQDAQRVDETADARSEIHQRIVLRGSAEIVGHFILGVGHSLANLVLRVLLLNPNGSAQLNKKFDKAKGFPPFSDEFEAWRTFNEGLAGTLSNCSRNTGNSSMSELGTALEQFWHSSFKSLDKRRGLDYHRRRPQSVANSAFDPVIPEDGSFLIPVLAQPSFDPRAEATSIFDQVTQTMSALSKVMVAIGLHIGDSIRGESFFFNADADWVRRRPDAAGEWAKEAPVP